MVITFTDIFYWECRSAYEWADEVRRKNAFLTQPIRLEFGDDFVNEKEGFEVSLFYDFETKKALFRRDWVDDEVTQFFKVTNFEEFEKKAPNAARRLLETGLAFYRKR